MKKYEIPEMEVTVFNTVSVVTDSMLIDDGTKDEGEEW